MSFNMNKGELETLKAFWTSEEIAQQPETWEKTVKQIASIKEPLQKFIDQVVKKDDFDIILTGAGTSEFVGNAAYSYLNKVYNHKVKSYATTDIVQTPENYLSKDKPTLLINFARSGNSPESVASVEIAQQYCNNIYHLFITCNKNGALAKDTKANCYSINLTDETNDQSFAMTSSFSNMYLAVLLALQLDNLAEITPIIEERIARAKEYLTVDYQIAKDFVNNFDFNRIVYLGGNALKGIAQESALKMLELTAGKVVTMYDTPMGFRHGPKSIIDPQTLVVVYMSDNEYSRQYEYDIIKEMSGERNGNKIIAISSHADKEVEGLVDVFYSFDNKIASDNAYLGLEYITIAQTIALFKSLSLNITPDNPCPTGEVNRVVKGVVIHPYGGK